jgi:hypothetical protein
MYTNLNRQLIETGGNTLGIGFAVGFLLYGLYDSENHILGLEFSIFQ